METEKTVDSCFILPIMPHKIGNVRDFWDDAGEKYRDDTEGQLKGVGIKRMLVFLQAIPEKGDFMVFFMQSADRLDRTLLEMFSGNTEYSKRLKEDFKDLTGVNMAKEENMPKIEMLADWADRCEYLEEKNMLKMPWCYAIPIKRGRSEELKNFASNMTWSKGGEIEQMLREYDIVRRLSFLQHAREGDFVVQHILTTHPLDELLMSVSSCDSKLCDDARKAIKEFCEVDVTKQENVPKVELLFKWDEKNGFKTAEQIIAYTE